MPSTKLRTAWVFVLQESGAAAMMTMDEYLAVKDTLEVLAVTRDLQKMCDLHAKYICIAKRRRLAESSIDAWHAKLLKEISWIEKQRKKAEADLRPCKDYL